jgi:1,4-dihydroxy-2-naphthoate octaprenyltransferase
MTALRLDAFHFLIRAILMLAGALLLWAAPVSIAGLVVMLVGLVCAVSAFTLEKTQQF